MRMRLPEVRLQNPITELRELSIYLAGMAEGAHNPKLEAAADWLKQASNHICAQGYFGCEGGERCTSDHK